MEDHYKMLGVRYDATDDEIRRAYRTLARRYHPDVNPGDTSADRFKAIAAAYDILSDPTKKKKLDELLRQERIITSSAFRAYSRQAAYKSRDSGSRTRRPQRTEKKGDSRKKTLPPKKQSTAAPLALVRSLWGKVSGKSKLRQASSISLIEVSVTVKEAVFGVKKTVDLVGGGRKKKIAVELPPGVRTGSVITLRSKSTPGEDIVVVTRVTNHPYLSVQIKGLVAEIPITINEAICGASITIPTLDGAASLRIPPGTQSGFEVRLKEKGIRLKNGTRGDLFLRFMVRVPEAPEAVGLKELGGKLNEYYEHQVRSHLTAGLLE